MTTNGTDYTLQNYDTSFHTVIDFPVREMMNFGNICQDQEWIRRKMHKYYDFTG